MKILLDTCIISQLRQFNEDSNLKRIVQEIGDENFFMSVISMGEIIKGIDLLEKGKRKQVLQSWIIGLEQFYSERLLPLDLETSRIWGEITASAQKVGRIIPAGDGLIAATAIRHGLHLMTFNISDFEPTGALLINPNER